MICGIWIHSIGEPRNRWSIDLIRRLEEKGATKIKAIFPGCGCELAELMIDDEVVAVNGLQLNGNLDEWLNYFKDNSIHLTICRNGKLFEVEIPEMNRRFYLKYGIEEQETPASAALLLRKWWASGKVMREHKG